MAPRVQIIRLDEQGPLPLPDTRPLFRVPTTGIDRHHDAPAIRDRIRVSCHWTAPSWSVAPWSIATWFVMSPSRVIVNASIMFPRRS